MHEVLNEHHLHAKNNTPHDKPFQECMNQYLLDRKELMEMRRKILFSLDMTP